MRDAAPDTGPGQTPGSAGRASTAHGLPARRGARRRSAGRRLAALQPPQGSTGAQGVPGQGCRSRSRAVPVPRGPRRRSLPREPWLGPQPPRPPVGGRWQGARRASRAVSHRIPGGSVRVIIPAHTGHTGHVFLNVPYDRYVAAMAVQRPRDHASRPKTLALNCHAERLSRAAERSVGHFEPGLSTIASHVRERPRTSL